MSIHSFTLVIAYGIVKQAANISNTPGIRPNHPNATKNKSIKNLEQDNNQIAKTECLLVRKPPKIPIGPQDVLVIKNNHSGKVVRWLEVFAYGRGFLISQIMAKKKTEPLITPRTFAIIMSFLSVLLIIYLVLFH